MIDPTVSVPRQVAATCCTGINGSHTANCPENTGDMMVCWCCGAEFPARYACLWGPNGSRCFQCEGHDPACRARVLGPQEPPS